MRKRKNLYMTVQEVYNYADMYKVKKTSNLGRTEKDIYHEMIFELFVWSLIAGLYGYMLTTRFSDVLLFAGIVLLGFSFVVIIVRVDD